MTKLDERAYRALSDILDLAPPPPDEPIDAVSVGTRTRPLLHAAAAAIVTVGVAGVAVLATRSDNNPTILRTEPPTSLVTSAPIPADGRMTLDPVPDGVGPGIAARASFSVPPETRIYAADHDRPELGVVVMVRAAPDTAPYHPGGADPVDVQSTNGFAWTDGDGSQLVTFGPVDGNVYSLTGYNMTRDELLAAAEGSRFSQDTGPTIDDTALPAGATELSAGSYNESPTFTPSAGEYDIERVVAGWGSEDFSHSVSYLVEPEYGAMFAVNRVGHDTVTDVEVNGHPGYLFVDEFPEAPRSVSVAWTDGERNVFLSGYGYTETELLGIAETLRPASPEEWSSMLLNAETGAEVVAPTTPGTTVVQSTGTAN